MAHLFVYNIPYRRARAWPSGCSAFRPSASREQRYLAYNTFVFKIPYRRARAWPSGCSAFRPSASREQRYLAYKWHNYRGI